MQKHQLIRLLALGAAWGVACPAQAQYTLHDGDVARLAGLLGHVALLLFGYWLGIPLLLGSVVVLGCRLASRGYRANALVPLALACLVWIGGLRWYDDYRAANEPANGLAPEVATLFAEAAAQQQAVVLSLLAAAGAGAALAGYFGVRKPRLAAKEAAMSR